MKLRPPQKKSPTKKLRARKAAEGWSHWSGVTIEPNHMYAMSWRIASSHPEFLKMTSLCLSGWEKDQFPREVYKQVAGLWRCACKLAYEFVAVSEMTIGGQRMIAEAKEAEIRRKIGAIADVRGSSFFTLEERETTRVSFKRACKFVTGLSDGPDAEKRFDRVFTSLSLREKGLMPLEHYREHGFAMIDLGVIREAWLKLPKEGLRKKYEKSGKYRRNKQGRKKNPKK